MLIRTLNGRIFTIQVDAATTTIKKLKIKIKIKTGIPVNRQRLIHQCVDLEDHQTIAYYNIQDDSIVNLVHNWYGEDSNQSIPEFVSTDESSQIFKAYADHNHCKGSWESENFWPAIKKKTATIEPNKKDLSYVYENNELHFKLPDENPYKTKLKQVYSLSIRVHELTNEMISIIRYYTSSGYAKTNLKLLSNFDIDWDYTNKLRSIIRGLQQSDLRSIYYRGINLSDIEVSWYIDKLYNCYYTNSFSSYTAEKEWAFPYNTLMILHTTPGNRLNIANVWHWSSYPHEMEAILSIGSKLKVLDIDHEDDRWIIHVELVGNE